MRKFAGLVLVCMIGCSSEPDTATLPAPVATPPKSPATQAASLREARSVFSTHVVSSGELAGAPEPPDPELFDLIYYPSPVGRLAAYVTPDPGQGDKRPAIVWITGGDTNSIGDVWSPQDRSNDQSACAFRKMGIVMLFPSLRGGNNNPGKREGFYGEVDDVLAATDYLAALPYVDANQIYLGGHSTGGTLAMLVAACSDRYRAVFSLGPAAEAAQYGGQFVYCDPRNEKEMRLRSPIHWLHGIQTPTYVLEGAVNGNWDGAIDIMAARNTNPKLQFFQIPRLDHFSVIAPVTEKLAEQIVNGQVNLNQETFRGLR
ncbi:MAG: alpha/beta hydrolase family protein [Planctomycetota bacterium]